jgi:hypothetical protein
LLESLLAGCEEVVRIESSMLSNEKNIKFRRMKNNICGRKYNPLKKQGIIFQNESN